VKHETNLKFKNSTVLLLGCDNKKSVQWSTVLVLVASVTASTY